MRGWRSPKRSARSPRRRRSTARRHAEISAVRRDLGEIPGLLRQALAEYRALLAAELQKYSSDQPRVPKGSRHGGEWTKESSDTSSIGAIDASERDAENNSKPGRQYAELDTRNRSGATAGTLPQLPPTVHLTSGQIIGSYLAGVGNYISQLLSTAGYYAADTLSFGAASESTDGPPTFAPFPVTSPHFAAEGAAAALGVTTVLGARSLGDALTPKPLATEGRLTAAQRVTQLAKTALRKIEDERFVTLAVTETREGVRIISSSSDKLEPAVVELLQEGERKVDELDTLR